MKRTIIILAVLLATAPSVFSRTESDQTTAILQKTAEILKGIHTASYDYSREMYYEPTDSFYYSKKYFHCLECENPADTARNALMVEDDSKGNFYRAYDGEYTYYPEQDKYISKSIPTGFNGIKIVKPPFFNFATSLVDYFLSPNPKLQLELEDGGDYWIIDGKIREFQLIAFFGKPYQMPSLPYPTSHFRLRIQKSTHLPDRISYLMGHPQQRWVDECSNVSLNPFPAESFSVADHIPDLPEPDGQEKSARTLLKEQFAKISGQPAPSDTLLVSDRTTLSLSQHIGHPIFLMFTSTNCGPCITSYPVINSFVKDYADKGLHVLGVMREADSQIEAIERYKQKHNLEFPLMRDNNHFHEYFSLGITHVFVLIDRDGIVRNAYSGFDIIQPEKTEKKLRAMIEEAL